MIRAGALTLGCLLAGLAPAKAQGIPVIDVDNLAQQLLQYGQQLKDSAQGLLDYARQGEQLMQETQMVTQEVAMLNSFVQNPNLGSAMGLMSMAGLQNPLPVNPYAVQGLLSGQGGISGALGQLSSLSTGSFNSNSYYNSNNGTWLGQEAANRANGIAGAQGIGMVSLQQIAAHIPILQDLRDKLSTATTPKEVQDAQAALATEQVWATNTGSQLQASALMYAAQRDADNQREDEQLNKSIDDNLAQAKAKGYWQ